VRIQNVNAESMRDRQQRDLPDGDIPLINVKDLYAADFQGRC
jgi:hypothetical protein